jgi:hypothetical protein
MGAVLGLIISWWLFVLIFYSFYCWAKKTDKSEAPVVRRFTALLYAAAWPYDLYKYFAGKQQKTSEQETLQQSKSKILE